MLIQNSFVSQKTRISIPLRVTFFSFRIFFLALYFCLTGCIFNSGSRAFSFSNRSQALQTSSIPADLLTTQIIEEAVRKEMHNNPQWHALLHMYNGRSKVQDSNFFLSEVGNQDAKAELIESIKNLIHTAYTEEVTSFECRFPARAAFIYNKLLAESKQGDFTKEKLYKKCNALNNWYSALNPKKMVVIFADAYFNNPASLFGHTFLRVDSSDDFPLLSYGIQYGASLTGDPGLLYAVKGIFGGYKGYYTILPYYESVKKYNDLEKRDLWEFELKLSDDEIRFLLMHLWELKGISFQYFYFDENCSFNMLSLLDVISEDRFFTRGMFPWVIPVDALKKAVNYRYKISKVTYRQSLRKQFEKKSNRLSEKEKQQARKLYKALNQSDEKKVLDQLSIVEKERVLEGVIDILMIEQRRDSSKEAKLFRLLHQKNIYQDEKNILVSKNVNQEIRSKQQTSREAVDEEHSPAQSHGSFLLQLSGGYSAGDGTYGKVTLRPAYHGILDPEPQGIKSSYSGLELLTTEITIHNDVVQFEKITPFSVLSLSPTHPLIPSFAWGLRTGVEQSIFDDPSQRRVLSLDGNFGKSYQLLNQGVFYVLPGLRSEFAGSDAPVSFSLLGGGLYNVTEHYRVFLQAGAYKSISNFRDESYTLEFTNRYTLDQNHALFGTFQLTRYAHESVQFGYAFYF
jgi:hypothetical protein